MLVKLYGKSADHAGAERKYSPGVCIGARKHEIVGAHVSTSFVERHNVTMRTSMKRFSRLGDGSSKKIDNHIYGLAFYFTWYIFAASITRRASRQRAEFPPTCCGCYSAATARPVRPGAGRRA